MYCCALPFFSFVHSVPLFRSSAAVAVSNVLTATRATGVITTAMYGFGELSWCCQCLTACHKVYVFKARLKTWHTAGKGNVVSLLGEQFLHCGSFTFDNSKIINRYTNYFFIKIVGSWFLGCFRSVLARCGNWCISSSLQLQVFSLIDDTLKSTWRRASGKNGFARTRIRRMEFLGKLNCFKYPQ